MEVEELDFRIKNKENELNLMLQDKLQVYQTRLHEKDALIVKIDQKNSEILKDFEYNLTVIKERDNDINLLSEKIESLISDNQNYEKKIILTEEENKRLLDDKDDRLTQKCEEVRTLYDKISELKNNQKFYKSGYIDEVGDYKKKLGILENALETTKQDSEKDFQNFKIRSELEKEEAIISLKGVYQDIITKLEKKNFENEENIRIERSKIYERDEELSKYRASLAGQGITLNQREDEADIQRKKVKLLEEQILTDKKRHDEEFQTQQLKVSENLREAMGKNSDLATDNLELKTKIENIKRKFKSRVSLQNESYDNKLVESVSDYKKRLVVIEDDNKRLEKENYELKFELQKLHENCDENKDMIRNQTDSVDEKLKKQVDEFKAQIDKLNAMVEVKDTHIKNLTQEKFFNIKKVDEVNYELKAEKDKVLVTEKENQILMDEILLFSQNKKIGAGQLNEDNNKGDHPSNPVMLERLRKIRQKKMQESDAKVIFSILIKL